MGGRVIIEFFPPLGEKIARKAVGRLRLEEEIGENDAIGGLLGRMAEKHDGFSLFYDRERQAVSGYVGLFINDATLPHEEMDTLLKDGDRISFIPEFVGG